MIWNSQTTDANGVNEAVVAIMNGMKGQHLSSLSIQEYPKSSNLTDFDTFSYKQRDTKPYRLGSYYFYAANSTSNKYSIVIFHNTTAIQAAPTFAHILGEGVVNAITFANYGKNFSIGMYNHPLPLTKKQENLASNAGTFTVTMIFSIGMAFIPTGLVTFIVKERENNVKHQHLVSGVSIPAYWLSSYAWDLSKFMVPGVLSVLMIIAFDLKSLTENSSVLTACWLLFILYGVAICPFTYACSFLFKSYSIAQFFIFIYNLILGAVCSIVVWTLRLITADTRHVADGLQ